MNEIEDRTGLDPEIRAMIERTANAVAEAVVESHDSDTDVTYATAAQLNVILVSIREGIIPTLTQVVDVPNTWNCLFNNGNTIYLNEHQARMVMDAVGLATMSEEIEQPVNTEELNDTLPDNNEESPLSSEEEELLEQLVEEAHNEIPKNSGSLLIDESTSRFSSAIWYEAIQKKTIVLAGIGGIGSYIGFLLARMKPASMFIYDPDIVETVNMSGQLYSRQDVGTPKVTALSRMISNYSDFNSVFAIPERFEASSGASDIMICGFDNMAARSIFFNKWLNHVRNKPEEERSNCLFIDGRLAAEEFQVLCIKGDDEYNINRYSKEFLFSDAQADETICSYKQTTFMANMIGSVIVNLFVNFVANQCNPLIDRDLPFYTTYSAETMYYKTEA